MAEFIDEVETYTGAIFAVLERVGRTLDPRKMFWCNYVVLGLERDELEDRVRKDTRKLEKEIDDDLYLSKLWYVGIPRFKLVRRGIAHLNCEIDLYYVAYDNSDDFCWYGKLIPKADRFEAPLSLIDPLMDALSQGQQETDNASVVERVPGYTVYDYLGREWKIPDAFLGFVWALKDRDEGFEGLLDPMSCLLMDKFTKELPSPEVPRLASGGYEEIVGALTNLGSTKVQAEEAAKYVMEKAPNESLENKIKQALSYLSG